MLIRKEHVPTEALLILVETAPHVIALYPYYRMHVFRLEHWMCSIFSNKLALAKMCSAHTLYSYPQIGMCMHPIHMLQ